MYMGESLKINDSITLRQVKLRDIIHIGERQYCALVSLFTAIPSDYKAMLWDSGIDWMEISDFEFFCLMLRIFPPSFEQSKLIFGDIDFSELVLGSDKDGNPALYDKNNSVLIDEGIYRIISNFICRCNSIVPKVEKAGNKATKAFLVQEDRERKTRKLDDPQNEESGLRSLISSLVNSAEFKYNISEVLDLTLLQLRDSAMRISIIRTSDVLYNGLYAQGVDTDKLDKHLLDWMRPLKK